MKIAQVLEIVAVILLLGAVGEFVLLAYRAFPDVLWLVCAGVLAGPMAGLVPPRLSSSRRCRCSAPSR